ncbi:MAG TPA: MBL fold metallo-hydrolase [Spirochaetia bacterium]|nr:MBL fold metallo-hydrolase [Spirochaetia bacterium]
MELFIKQLNPHSCRTYLIGREGGGEVILIDPVLDHFLEYADMLKAGHLQLTHVVDSHTHADHISGAAALKDFTECSYVMYKDAPARCVDFSVDDGFEWKLFDRVQVRVLSTPGHTQDSISLVFPEWILTGDTLFLDDGGAGRDDLPGGDPGAHWESLKRLSGLPEHLIVYPAHDYRNRKPSSLGQQKRTNPHMKARSKEEFIRYLEDLRLGPADWMKDVLKANYACARDPKAAWIPVDAAACEVKGTLDPGVNEMQVTSIPPRVLKQKMKSSSPPVLLDVREKHELAGNLGHIDGIVHIPIGSLVERIPEMENIKDREIVVVCRSGARAHTAAQILSKAGIPNVSVLSGGMIAWNTAR